MDSLAVVPINHEMAVDVRRTAIKNKIIERIQELKINIESYKGNSTMLLLICNLAEHLVKKKYKIDKKELVVDIMHELFQLNSVERITVQNNIEFLFNNGNIKKASAFYLFCVGVKEYFVGKKK